MKCAYQTVRNDKLRQKFYEHCTTVALEAIDSTVGCAMIDTFRWGKSRLCKLFSHNETFIIDIINTYRSDSIKVDTYRGVREGNEADLLHDALTVGFSAMNSRLRSAGLDMNREFGDMEEAYEMMRHEMDVGRHKESTDYILRRAWYIDIGGAICKAFIAGTMLYLHEDCEFGESRLFRAYRPIVTGFERYLDLHMQGTPNADKELKSYVRDCREKLLSKEIKLIGLKEGH